MNICVHALVRVPIFKLGGGWKYLGMELWGRIPNVYFLENYQTVFRFIFPAAKREGSHFSTCSPTFFHILNPTIVGQGRVSALQRKFPAQGS